MASYLKQNWFLILVGSLLGLALLLLVFWLIYSPQILVRNGKTTIKTSDIFFYIPSVSPIKIYKLESKTDQLRELIESDIEGSEATFGVFIKNLNTGQQVTINPDESFDSASLYKLALMYAIFYNGHQGKLDINDPQIQQNLEAMITVSSNEAAFWFIDQNLTSWDQATDLVHQIGMSQTFLNQGQPTTTPKDIALFLEQLVDGKLVSFNDSLKMLSLMSDQEVNDRIPVTLPKGTLIAHKTGDLDGVTHDVGVVGSEKSDYIIVLMSKDSANLAETKKIMQKISVDVYNFFEEQLKTPAEIL